MVVDEYMLPTDAAERERLATQHRLWKLMIGDIYPTILSGKVQDVLQSTSGNDRATILDVGCGSGIWAMDMARRFPDALVYGCDINEWHAQSNTPANFRFARGDITDGLPEDIESLQFDVIHCRCVAQHVSDPAGLVALIANALKPGGLLLLADGDWIAFDRNRLPLMPFVFNADLPEDAQRTSSTDRSFYAGWLHLFGKLTRSRKYKPIDVLLHDDGHFEDIVSNSYFTPINWDGVGIDNGEQMGIIMNENMREFFRNARDRALKSGITDRMLDIWEEEYLKEFEHCRYNIWHYSSGCRKRV